MTTLALSRRQYLEFEKIAVGAFAPLDGFMGGAAFDSVVRHMRLPGGEVFPLPVVLDLDDDQARDLRGANRIRLIHDDVEVGTLEPGDMYSPDRGAAARRIFGTDDRAHPGVDAFARLGGVFVGGAVSLSERISLDLTRRELLPAETRRLFAERGWRTVAGFQTRNVPHRAHEYLQRVALEIADGLFIQPLIGQRRAGDWTPEAVIAGYDALIEGFYPPERVVFGVLTAAMRFAGPREAVFHALIRRNHGCSHFIVGRDHAGVGDYYGIYDAQALCRSFGDELGIRVLCLHGPWHCARCDGIVSDRSCRHGNDGPDVITPVSGTAIRAALEAGALPDPRMMRPEVHAAIRDLPLFVPEDEA